MPPRKEKFGHIMVDLETLDTASTGVILSIGAVRFNEQNIDDDGFYRVIKIDSNLHEHRTISESTLVWWLGQSDKAKAVFTDPNKVPLGDALDEFRAWGGSPLDWKHTEIWANSPDFDCAMLANAYGLQGTPWQFYNTRCYRTMKSTPAGRRVPKPENVVAHNALFDAIAQAQHLQAIWAAGVGK